MVSQTSQNFNNFGNFIKTPKTFDELHASTDEIKKWFDEKGTKRLQNDDL